MAFLRRNLKMCPQTCRKSAYISLARSILDYGAIIWDPYYIKNIVNLERVQRQTARFIIEDYKTREKGCITKNAGRFGTAVFERKTQHEPSDPLLQSGRGVGPAYNTWRLSETDLQKKTHAHVRAKKYSDYQSSNIIERQVINHDKCFVVEKAKTEQNKHPIFIGLL